MIKQFQKYRSLKCQTNRTTHHHLHSPYQTYHSQHPHSPCQTYHSHHPADQIHHCMPDRRKNISLFKKKSLLRLKRCIPLVLSFLWYCNLHLSLYSLFFSLSATSPSWTWRKSILPSIADIVFLFPPLKLEYDEPQYHACFF